MVHKHTKSTTRPRSAGSPSSPLDRDMDRKVYIPLCFCLVSFAVMVYIHCKDTRGSSTVATRLSSELFSTFVLYHRCQHSTAGNRPLGMEFNRASIRPRQTMPSKPLTLWGTRQLRGLVERRQVPFMQASLPGLVST
ncbi:hypothetical protein BO86DRAFT_145770 [Aspergillus japonicus CBS 114.51]|uniref:Uncharacterized protein n=1 Tax=Aspergillus japonicus CBS 114.51 TaxID=1448312 RepID=A0A8T8WWU8_ASPJA|nr:hypothetical protein BO86DRAFT_145770 [Aspergillus japonicus CBS 114.51]RAH79872.1 hypothetical protein BO86DRAFT_145770 [Aspergillus japonicus CBS 114.51]